MTFETIAVVALGASLVLSGSLTLGMLFAFVSLKVIFSTRVSALVDCVVQFRLMGNYLDRLADIALQSPEKHSPEPSRTISSVQGELRLDSVSYRYSPADPHVIANVSLRILKGESVAISGPSGSGKTTLIKLMLGLLDPTDGKVLIDGQDLNEIGLDNYRRHLAAVMQEDSFFAGTLAENVAFFHKPIDNYRLREACEIARVAEDIENLPMGFNTRLGDMGSTLSSGQQQRLMLARALYVRPKILFLDEATNHIDTLTETRIFKSLLKLRITTVVVSHRPETLRHVDRIINIEEYWCSRAAE